MDFWKLLDQFWSFYNKNKFDSKPPKPLIALSNFPHSAGFRGQIAKVVFFSNECNNLLHAIFDKTMPTLTIYKKWSEFFRNNKKQVGTLIEMVWRIPTKVWIFCNKSFWKDEPLTSWTLLHHTCPYFLGVIAKYNSNHAHFRDYLLWEYRITSFN